MNTPTTDLGVEWVLGVQDDALLPSRGDLRALVAAATKARLRAHAPESGFMVGAALLTRSGRIFTGGNVEATNGDSICAERCAAVKAISEGYGEYTVICAIADTEAPVTPCGQCRQLLSDLSPKALVVMATTRHCRVEVARLDALFPRGNFKTGA